MDVCLVTCPASSLPAAEHPGSSRAAGDGPQARRGSWRSRRAGEVGRQGRAPAHHHSICDKGRGASCGQKTCGHPQPGPSAQGCRGCCRRHRSTCEACPGESLCPHLQGLWSGVCTQARALGAQPWRTGRMWVSAQGNMLLAGERRRRAWRPCPGSRDRQAAMPTSPTQGCVPGCSSAHGEGAPTGPSEHGNAWAPHGSLGPGHPPEPARPQHSRGVF